MHHFLKCLVAVLAGAAMAFPADAQQYELSTQWQRANWAPGSWNGKHSFLPVYCLSFPDPGSARELRFASFNRNAIYLTEVYYPDDVRISVAVSSIPGGRTAESEMARLLTIEKQAETAYSHDYGIKESQTAFGPTINLRIKDVAPRGRSGPFPLVRAIIRPAHTPIETLSVHRLFVRGPDRFEVAAFQLAPQLAEAETELKMSEHLTSVADRTVQSLQECTQQLPIRTQ
jgi:hypothetical protein